MCLTTRDLCSEYVQKFENGTCNRNSVGGKMGYICFHRQQHKETLLHMRVFVALT